MMNNSKSNFGSFLSGALVATALGGYFLFVSKHAKKNRQKVDDVLEDVEDEVLAKVKKVKRLSRDKYYEIVDDVSDKYTKMKKIGTDKADDLRAELRKKWEEIKDELDEEDE